MNKPQRFSDLKSEQKEAIGLLSIGTFLEYFDLMLYVHMAVLLNELFFKPTDPYNASLLAAAAFCSTYLLRPLGALIFGWIGDNIGRKTTVVITTVLMSASCVAMATLPTYEEIGITATVVVTVCRILQGMSSMGEVIGAELYVTEITRPPVQYPAVALVTIFASIGGFAALLVANFSIKYGYNWRYAFWMGAIIAIIGAVARTRLRETPEFADAKRRLAAYLESADHDSNALHKTSMYREKVNKRSALALFLIQCAWPVCFYLIYFHCSNIAKDSFEYTSEQVIHQNLIVSIFQVASFVLWTYLSIYVYPLTLLKFKLAFFSIIAIMIPALLTNISSPNQLLFLQILLVMFSLSYSSAMPIFYKHFPVFKRFTCASFTYAVSRIAVYLVTSFGLVYLTRFFGNWGMLVIILPTVISFAFGIVHFENLEILSNNISKKQKHSNTEQLMASV